MKTLTTAVVLLLVGTSVMTIAAPNDTLGPLVNGETIFVEDFEAGWGDWYPDNGVWEVGTPASRSERAYRGEIWAATILDGDYPGHQDSRLISPLIALPAVRDNERIQLRLWHSFSYSSYDSGTVQISAYDAVAGQWENWTSLPSVSGVSAVWSPMTVDLTTYAGNYVRIAFLHTARRSSSNNASESWGWYIEELEIRKGTPVFQNPEGFEAGWGDWYAENGIWEVGQPTSGPSEILAGNAVAGTVLDGDYPGFTDSRLVSPIFRIPELAELPLGNIPELRFRHWFNYSSYDSGTVQISVYDPTTGEWGDWANLTSIDGVSGIWSPMRVDLTAYAGDYVHIAFQHTAGRSSSNNASESSGWYIDDVQIPEGNKRIVLYDFPLDSDPEWDMEGQWEYGVPAGQGGEDHGHPDPTSGHTEAYVIGVNLNGNYAVTLGDRYALIAGPFDLSGHEDVTLEYARCLNTDEPDYVADAVEVSVDGQENWYPLWQHTRSGPLTDSGWTVMQHALGALANNQPTVYVRWSYQILDARAFAYSGWNIDDVKLIK